MKFLKILIIEGRKEDLKKKYSDKFSQEDLDFILNISDLEDFNHKYTDFVLRVINPESDDIGWWVETIIEELKLFDKYQSQLTKKDINQYKSFYELQNEVSPFHQKEKDKELEKQVDKIYEDNKFLVVSPKTEDASCKYGSNTKWCVTSKGSGYFERYTRGNQKLYFIINKENSTDQDYSKVAVHFDMDDQEKMYDSKDVLLSQREVGVMNYAFPEIMDAIRKDYKKRSISKIDEFLVKVFDIYKSFRNEKENFYKSNYDLIVIVNGFENVKDLGFGHAVGSFGVVLKDKSGIEKTIDGYDIFMQYKTKDNRFFSVEVGFQGLDFEEKDIIDLGFENKSYDYDFKFEISAEETSDSVRRIISNSILSTIQQNMNSPKSEFASKISNIIHGGRKVWMPNRSSYGYTFGRNKGLIKKLIDYLESGNSGTKLDFLEYIGKLTDKRVIDGKVQYKVTPNSPYWSSSTDLRGHFSSFFASAKNAGIIEYEKKGKNFIIKKGPNFEDFKEGKLKAL